jgi:hypothetical protein
LTAGVVSVRLMVVPTDYLGDAPEKEVRHEIPPNTRLAVHDSSRSVASLLDSSFGGMFFR